MRIIAPLYNPLTPSSLNILLNSYIVEIFYVFISWVINLVLRTSKGVTIKPEIDPATEPDNANYMPPSFIFSSGRFCF